MLDPKTLQTKYIVDLGDITRISVTPFKDGVIVFHIRTVGVYNKYLTNATLGQEFVSGGNERMQA